MYADGVVGGAAAGHLHGLVHKEPSAITIWHAGKGNIASMGDGMVTVRFRRGAREGVGSPSRTKVEQTLLDLASESTESGFIMAVTQAVATRRTVPDRVVQMAARHRRLERREVLLEVLEAAGDGVQSVLEMRFRQVLEAHGLPEPALQKVLLASTRSDATWLEFGVVVELDGRLGHEDAPFRDMDRDNRLVLQGVATLRFGWHDVLNRPCEVARQVLQLLRMHGYAGPAVGCTRCS